MGSHANVVNNHSTLCQTNAGDPTGSVTPDHTGAICYDTTNHRLYYSTGTGVNDWTATAPGLPRLQKWICHPSASNHHQESNIEQRAISWGPFGVSRLQDPNTIGGASHTWADAYSDIVIDTDGGEAFRALEIAIQDDVDEFMIDVIVSVPPNFSHWKDDAIVWDTKADSWATAGEDLNWTMRVFNPRNLTTALATETRTTTNGTNETAYTGMTISAGELGAMYGGQCIIVQMQASKTGAGTVAVDVHLGRLTFDWA